MSKHPAAPVPMSVDDHLRAIAQSLIHTMNDLHTGKLPNPQTGTEQTLAFGIAVGAVMRAAVEFHDMHLHVSDTP